MERLFDIDLLQTSKNYISQQEKKKWNEAFKNWILEEYDKKSDLDYGVNCGGRKYCDVCEIRYSNGCSDCLAALKRYCRRHNITIDYRDFDFEKLIKKVEE